MVKTLKRQGECTDLTKQKNDGNDHSTWSCSKCQEFLAEHRVIKIGKLEALRKDAICIIF